MTFNPPLPKEHGSWVMLVVPLLLGLAIAPVWQGRALLLLVAALGFFLLRYPLALLVKGRKRASTNRTYLWGWTLIYGVITALAGGWLVLAERLWWLAALGVVGGGLLFFHLWLVARRQEMSVTGELAGIFGLALGAPMAYYTATGRLDRTAALLWLINALYFGGTVFYIKLKVRTQPRQPAPPGWAARLQGAKAGITYHTAALSLMILVVLLWQAPALAPLALLPATAKMIYGAYRWQDKKSLSLVRLGLIEMGHALVFSGLVMLAFGMAGGSGY